MRFERAVESWDAAVDFWDRCWYCEGVFAFCVDDDVVGCCGWGWKMFEDSGFVLVGSFCVYVDQPPSMKG